MRTVFIFICITSVLAAEELVDRAYTANVGDLTEEVNWSKDEAKRLQQENVWTEEKLTPLRAGENGAWFDVREQLELMGIGVAEDGYAHWNQGSRLLMARVAKAEAAKLDALLAHENDEAVDFEVQTVFVSCTRTPGPKEQLLERLDFETLFGGEYGEPKTVASAVSAIRSGHRGMARIGDKLDAQFDVYADLRGIQADLNFYVTFEVNEKVAFENAGSTVMKMGEAEVVPLGGAGTEESPLYVMIVRVWRR